MKHRAATLAAAMIAMAVLVAASPCAAGSQMFPVKRPTRGLSAYLIAPSEGLKQVPPEGWKHITSQSFGNAALADEAFDPETKVATLTTASDPLPRDTYTVSILCRGEGKARLVGADEWTPLKTPKSNYFAWVELGTVKDATQVAVEVGATGGRFCYGGLLAEGERGPEAIPVAEVTKRIRAGGPATVVLLGDSVTENAGGRGGGSSSFDKGNPGLMLALLRELSGTEPGYIAHREPPNWPADRKAHPEKVPTAEIGGRTVYDARQEFDDAARVRLLNLGRGGAAANYGWSRMSELVVESDYFDAKLPRDQRKSTVRYGLPHYEPDLVIINFGTNDVNAVHENWGVEGYMFHMKVLATMIQRRLGAAVILSTPHKWTSGTHLFPHEQPQMVEALRDYCRATGLALADVYNEYGPGQYDGIHPGDRGHAHLVAAYRKAMLGEPSAPKIKARITAADLADNGDGTVTDAKAGLMWAKDAGAKHEALSPEAAAELIAKMNREKRLGHDDWRLPTRDELLGMIDPTERRPALPAGHPFENVGNGFYLTSDGRWGVDLATGTAYAPMGRAKTPLAGYAWPVRSIK